MIGKRFIALALSVIMVASVGSVSVNAQYYYSKNRISTLTMQKVKYPYSDSGEALRAAEAQQASFNKKSNCRPGQSGYWDVRRVNYVRDTQKDFTSPKDGYYDWYCGDLNLDGKISLMDADILNRILEHNYTDLEDGIFSAYYVCTDGKVSRTCDVNGDNVIDYKDVKAIEAYVELRGRTSKSYDVGYGICEKYLGWQLYSDASYTRYYLYSCTQYLDKKRVAKAG